MIKTFSYAIRSKASANATIVHFFETVLNITLYLSACLHFPTTNIIKLHNEIPKLPDPIKTFCKRFYLSYLPLKIEEYLSVHFLVCTSESPNLNKNGRIFNLKTSYKHRWGLGIMSLHKNSTLCQLHWLYLWTNYYLDEEIPES